jgi:hypothetical protein
MKQEKWNKLHKELDEALDSEFGKAKLALREYLLENKEKVAADLDEMREKSNQNKMKQTAVEWLIEQWPILESQIPERILEQAKEMERDQIVDAYWASYKEGQYSGDKTADEYYNETFKSE